MLTFTLQSKFTNLAKKFRPKSISMFLLMFEVGENSVSVHETTRSTYWLSKFDDFYDHTQNFKEQFSC